MADRGRCRSMDDMFDFSSVKPRLKNIVSQLEKICEDTSERKEWLPWKAGGAAVAGAGGVALFTVLTGGVGLVVAGAAAAGAGAGATAGRLALFTVLTGGLGLVAGGAAAAAAGAAAGAGVVVALDTLLDKNIIDEVKRLVEEFCDLVQPLKNVQPEKRAMLEELNKKLEETIIRLVSLIVGLFTLFINFKSNSTLRRLLEVTKQCKNILKELEELMKSF